jgi:hypothetical protein
MTVPRGCRDAALVERVSDGVQTRYTGRLQLPPFGWRALHGPLQRYGEQPGKTIDAGKVRHVVG